MPTKRIMVVDDEPLVLKSVRRVLSQAGYLVEGVSNGAEALRRLKVESFDLLVTDWKMPIMKGDSLAVEVRKTRPELPVLLLTGSILETPPKGFDGILCKPFSLKELRTVVSSLAGDPG